MTDQLHHVNPLDGNGSELVGLNWALNGTGLEIKNINKKVMVLWCNVRSFKDVSMHFRTVSDRFPYLWASRKIYGLSICNFRDLINPYKSRF